MKLRIVKYIGLVVSGTKLRIVKYTVGLAMSGPKLQTLKYIGFMVTFVSGTKNPSYLFHLF